MTKKEEIEKMLPILQAFVEGKEIEIKTKEGSRWSKFNEDDFEYLNLTKCDFRIKPESTYRPFKDAEECWQEMQKHQPFGWVRSKNNNDIYCLSAVEDCGIITYLGDWEYDLAENRITFADGEPFGVKEEE